MKIITDRIKAAMPLDEYTSGGKYDAKAYYEGLGYRHFFTTIQDDFATMEFCRVEERGE